MDSEQTLRLAGQLDHSNASVDIMMQPTRATEDPAASGPIMMLLAFQNASPSGGQQWGIMMQPTRATEDSESDPAGPIMMLLAFQNACPSGGQQWGRLPRSPLQVRKDASESESEYAQRVSRVRYTGRLCASVPRAPEA